MKIIEKWKLKHPIQINAISVDGMQRYKRLSQKNIKETVQTSNNKDIKERELYPASYSIYFAGKKHKKDGINVKIITL